MTGEPRGVSRVVAGFSSFDGEYSLPHVLSQGSPIFHSSLKGELGATPWTVAGQARLSMGFSRQEYWSGLPFPSPGDLPDPGIEPAASALQADFSLQ